MGAALDAALAAAGRDPYTIRRSVEALVEPSGAPVDEGAADTFGSWERPFAGAPAAIAAGLTRYRELGFDHVQVQLRPNTVASVTAFAPVLEALRAG